jgi:hypothetical protein
MNVTYDVTIEDIKTFLGDVTSQIIDNRNDERHDHDIDLIVVKVNKSSIEPFSFEVTIAGCYPPYWEGWGK